MPPFLLALALLLSLLSLQIGFSFWLSGTTLGCIVLLYAIFSSRQANWSFPKKYIAPLLFGWFFLAARILYADSSIRSWRLVFVMSLLSLFPGFMLGSNRLLARKISLPIILSSVASIYFLMFFYVLSFIPGSFLNGSNLSFFQQKWLVANLMFDNLDVAIQALDYKYIGLIDRVSLLYGEPSYMAVVLLCCGYIAILSFSFCDVLPLSSRFLSPLLSINSVFLSVILALFLLIVSGSFFGILSTIFLVGLYFLLPPLSNSFRQIRLISSVSFFIFPLLSFFGFFANNPLVELSLLRFYNIFTGIDDSAGGRIYTLPAFFSYPFGCGMDCPSIALALTGYSQMDSGIVSSLLLYGVFWISFLFAFFYLLYRNNIVNASFCFYLILCWSQNGSVFSFDKFFLGMLPLPVVVLAAQCMRNRLLPSVCES